MMVDAVDLADLGEAALDAAELGEAVRRSTASAMPSSSGDADRGERVLDVVAAGHRQLDAGDRADLAVRGRGATRRSGCRPGSGVTLSPRMSAWAAKP